MSSKCEEYQNLWDFFGGHIRCINLTNRKDRYRCSKKVFEQYHIPVDYYKTTKHPNGGKQGCFESHIDIIRQAYDAGAERVLIFEDDITVTDYMSPAHLRKAIKFMDKNKWDLFYLGALPNIKKKLASRTGYSGIYKLKGVCTHAYVVNRSAMKRLVNLKYKGVEIDYYYINTFNNCYALYPTLFYQGLSDSDIIDGSHWWSSYASENTVSTFYRCVECYAYYVNYPLYMIVPLLIIIAAWFVCGMDQLYHNACIFALVLALLFLGIFTWD